MDNNNSNYRIYITIAGMKIAGMELSRTGEEINIRGAAYAEMDPSQTKVNFYAISMVEPEKILPLRMSALLTDVQMAPMIAERFKLYLAQLDLEAKVRELNAQVEEHQK